MVNQIDNIQFLKKSWPQIEDCVCNSSVGLLERTDSDVMPYNLPSSGTLIAIENRLFIATAAHTIPQNPNGGRLWVLGEKRQYPFNTGALEFIRYKKAQGVDVGYLELDPDNATNYLECQPCPIERIRTLGPGREQQPVALVGTPNEFVNHGKGPTPKRMIPVVKPFLTESVKFEDWPDVTPTNSLPKADIDVFLEFPREGVAELVTNVPLVFETAKGYSGGGVWDLGFESKSLWQPTEVSLFGIQSKWDPTRRYLRAVQVIHWLRLVHDDYPDLQPVLKKLFPALNQAK